LGFTRRIDVPVEVLIQAIAKGPWKKGYPIVAMDLPIIWGNRERPPWCVVVRITDATKAQVEQYLARWENTLSYEILTENDLGYRIKASVSPAVAQQYPEKAMRQVIKDYLVDNWNAQIVSSDGNESVTFDVPKPIVLQDMKDDVLDKFQEKVDVRQFSFTTAQVDQVLAAGGLVERTMAQVLSIIQDHNT
jgi:hypothetical protein